MAADVARTKWQLHVVVCENATCHTFVHVRACMSEHVCECAHVCVQVCINNKIAPFLEFLLSHYIHMTYIRARLSDFLPCGTIFLFLCAQVTW